MDMRLLTIIAMALLLGGCAAGNKSLYDWGDYDGMLYGSYKDPTTVGANIQKLEQHIQKLEAARQKVPPGVYADCGMLLLQSGNREKAQTNFKKERDAWPESAPLMNALINNAAMPKANEVKS
jgi:hypothetical protein